MKKHKGKQKDDLRPEYDMRQLLKEAVRGKYATRYRAGPTLVVKLRKVGSRKARVN